MDTGNPLMQGLFIGHLIMPLRRLVPVRLMGGMTAGIFRRDAVIDRSRTQAGVRTARRGVENRGR